MPNCPQAPSSHGYCRDCGKEHLLAEGETRRHCLALMDLLESHRTLDLFPASKKTDPRLTTDHLFGEARGKMFGIMECLNPQGELVLLRAFSGQFNGVWDVPGWAPPLFSVQGLESLSYHVEKEIKELGRKMLLPDCGPEKRLALLRSRRALSQGLMRQIHGLYRLANFRGRQDTLFATYSGENGIPTGTGDCCAPKLFNLAARQNLVPVGIAEFYWGRENRSGSRRHGLFYPSCREKCQPILGYMLCGLEELHAEYIR